MQLGVDRLGFVLAPSPRQLSLEHLDDLLKRVPAEQAWVAVTVNAPPELLEALLQRGCRYLQLHGQEQPADWADFVGRAQIMRALRLQARPQPPWHGDELLFDGPGQGRTFPWEWLTSPRPPLPFWLAGGLTPDNLKAAIAEVRPLGVDVSSGVESRPGEKDPGKIRQWMEIVRTCR